MQDQVIKFLEAASILMLVGRWLTKQSILNKWTPQLKSKINLFTLSATTLIGRKKLVLFLKMEVS